MKERKALRMILALVLCLSLTLNVFAAAGTVEVETTAGNSEIVDVEISIDEKVNADGSTTTNTTTSANEAQTESGLVVDYSGNQTETKDKEGNVTASGFSSSYTVSGEGYIAQGGSETSTGTQAPEGTVSIPTTDKEGENTASANGAAVGTTTITGNQDQGTGEYDYTETTVKQQGSITVTTDKVDMEDNADSAESDLDYVNTDTNPDGTNDLVWENPSLAPDMYLPGADEINPDMPVHIADGYGFVYVGTGNTSQLRPAIVFTEPLTPEQKVEQFGDHPQNGAYIYSGYYTKTFVNWLDPEYRATVAKTEDGQFVTDEEGYILDIYGNRVLKQEKTVVGPDGETYYLHRFDNLGSSMNVEGWYQDGEWIKELNGSNKYAVVYSAAQQFVLVDQNTGEVVTVYCADLSTRTEDGFGYTIENLEDATYYTDAQAELIRSIALTGYWGNTGYETDVNGDVVVDEDGNPVPAVGSLEALKAHLLASGQFTEEELEALTDGVALTATQMAIWSCSNKMQGVEFINTHYVGKPGDTNTDLYGAGALGNVPEEKEAEALLMFKLYEYLIALEPTSYEEEKTTANTIINEQNFIKDMSLSVLGKAEDHAANKDNDTTNDAYIGSVTFALVVTPSTENGDDMIVKLMTSDGSTKQFRIAGNVQAGEDMEYLTPDENGNYTISGLTLTEGDYTFEISLDGVQRLDEGVYLYTSEVRDVDGDKVTSQTFVGIAGGEQAVNVSMTVDFNLDIEDEVVNNERVWRTETDVELPPPNENEVPPEDPNNPPTPGYNTPGKDVPPSDLTEIDEEDVPLADVPQTGDHSALFLLLAGMSAVGLAALVLTSKRRTEED